MLRSNPDVRGAWWSNVTALLSLCFVVLAPIGQAWAADALPFSNSFLVTGNYAVSDPDTLDSDSATGRKVTVLAAILRPLTAH